MLYRPPLPEGALAPPAASSGSIRRTALLVSVGLGILSSAMLTVWARRCPQRTHRSCHVSSRSMVLPAADRARLEAEREAVAARLGDYEAALSRGEACRSGGLRLRIELLRLDEQLAPCPRQRALLRAQRAQLEAQRARVIAGSEVADQPAGL